MVIGILLITLTIINIFLLILGIVLIFTYFYYYSIAIFFVKASKSFFCSDVSFLNFIFTFILQLPETVFRSSSISQPT